MTTILYYENRIYADSAVYKGSERLESLNKIRPIGNPFRIKSDKEDFVFDDVVHGWVGTGNYQAMGSFVEAMEQSSKNNKSNSPTLLFYSLAAASNLGLSTNLFEVLMVGEKALHSFRFELDVFVYTRYEKTSIVAMGSGGRDAMTHVRFHGDPLRAMLQTFMTDEVSGGFIDCWELEEQDKKFFFRRKGLCEDLPKDVIPHLLKRWQEKSPDETMGLQYVPRTENLQHARDQDNKIVALEIQNARLKTQLKKLRADLRAAKQFATLLTGEFDD